MSINWQIMDMRYYRDSWKFSARNDARLPFYRRADMRWCAWRYAEARGWTVKLTPPQRSRR